MDKKIEELIEKADSLLEREEMEREAARIRQEQERAIRIATTWDKVIATAKEALPEVAEYIIAPDTSGFPNNMADLCLELPECVRIRFVFDRQDKVVYRDEYLVQTDHYLTLDHDFPEDADGPWTIHWNGSTPTRVSGLIWAIGHAHRAFMNMTELQLEADAKNKEWREEQTKAQAVPVPVEERKPQWRKLFDCAAAAADASYGDTPYAELASRRAISLAILSLVARLDDDYLFVHTDHGDC